MKLRFRVWYDGTNFSGWQIQPHKRTVQGELNAALQKISESESQVYGAGRTDAGVHSTGQIAHCEVSRDWDLDAFQNAMNSNLPDDIFINDVRIATNDFHARFSATSRFYVYRCSFHYNPLRRHYEYFLKQMPKLELFEECLSKLVGNHDFQSFIQSGSDPDTVCTLYSARSECCSKYLRVFLHADRFGWKMARKIVAVCLAIGNHRFPITLIDDMLNGYKEPKIAPVPASGLILAGVTYPSELGGPSTVLDEWLEASTW